MRHPVEASRKVSAHYDDTSYLVSVYYASVWKMMENWEISSS